MPDIDFEDGASWSCTKCARSQTIEWDGDLEETTGMPSYYSPHEDIALCEVCADVEGGPPCD